MENREKQIQILNYLDKNYQFKDGKFFTKYNDIHEWGCKIVESLSIIFSFNIVLCESEFSKWAYAEGITNDQWETAYQSHKLKATWVPEMIQDLQAYGVVNAEENLIAAITEEISKEINSEILYELKTKVKTYDEFLSLVKCVGYETSLLMYDVETFTPRKYFISMTHNDIINERKNNTFWQDWIKNHPS